MLGGKSSKVHWCGSSTVPQWSQSTEHMYCVKLSSNHISNTESQTSMGTLGLTLVGSNSGWVEDYREWTGHQSADPQTMQIEIQCWKRTCISATKMPFRKVIVIALTSLTLSITTQLLVSLRTQNFISRPTKDFSLEDHWIAHNAAFAFMKLTSTPAWKRCSHRMEREPT